MKNFRKLAALLLAAGLALPTMSGRVQAASLAVISETTTHTTVTSGLTYEKVSKLTNLGWVDIYVLKMDLNNDYVDLDIIRSTDTWGKRDALTSIMDVNDSVAAINATFFDMSGTVTESIGPEYEDGQFSYLQHNYNTSSLGAASLMVTDENTVDIDFFGAQISFTSETGNSIYISAINSLANFANPVVLNTNAMLTTAQIESKGNFYKMIVEDGVVTGYVNPKTTADIPDNGYVVVLDAATALKYTPVFPVGTKVNLGVNSMTTDSLYNMIISGGGTILKDGQVVKEGMIIAPDARNPRTALGVTQDQKYLVAMVIDGRGDSIGATHNELAMYLQEYGVSDAIYMDGGGSSTMATRNLGTQYITLDNVPSDGAQRKVVNGLGFVSTAPEGTLSELKITQDEVWISKDMPVSFTVLGYDEYYNPVSWSAKALDWSSEGIEGYWDGSTFTPTTGGEGTVTCTYNGVSTTAKIHVIDQFIDLDADQSQYHTDLGGSVAIQVVGTDSNGYEVPINTKNLTYAVADKSLGFVEDGVFYARQKKGATQVTIASGDETISVNVTIGTELVAGTSFENAVVTSAVYPSDVIGSANLASGQHFDGAQSVQINYSFAPYDETQAVYAVLDGITFDSSVMKFGLNAYGNNSKLKFKAKLVDANNEAYYVTLADSIDFDGWKYLETDMPANMTYPVRLERVYVATLAHADQLDGSIYFDLLAMRKTSSVSASGTSLDVPETDPLRLKNVQNSEYTVTLFGPTMGGGTMLGNLITNKVMQKTEGAELAIFAGATQVDTSKILADREVIWGNTYKAYGLDDVKVINLATNAGGLVASDYTQWSKLMAELEDAEENNIIIVGNKNPLKDGDFSDSKEAGLFLSELSAYKEESGKTIYYINGSGNDFNVNNYRGIRFVDLNGLRYNIKDKSIDLNNTFYLLKLQMKDGILHYDYENLYPEE